MWSTGGISLSDLATNHLQTASSSVFSFISLDDIDKKEETQQHALVKKEVSKHPDSYAPENSSETSQADSKNSLELNELEVLSNSDSFVSDTGLDRNRLITDFVHTVMPSEFGCALTGQATTKEQMRFAMRSCTNTHFKFSAQDRQRPHLYGKPHLFTTEQQQAGDVIPFNFSSPSPDDIILAKQRDGL